MDSIELIPNITPSDAGSDVEIAEVAEDFNCTANTIAMPSEIPENVDPNVASALFEIERQNDLYLRGLADVDRLIFDWNQDPATFHGVKEQFIGTAGPTFPVDDLSPLDVLEKIWDDQIMNLIVEETNAYARQLRKNTKDKSRITDWTDVTLDELWTFFGILILQSLDPRPVETEFW